MLQEFSIVSQKGQNRILLFHFSMMGQKEQDSMLSFQFSVLGHKEQDVIYYNFPFKTNKRIEMKRNTAYKNHSQLLNAIQTDMSSWVRR